MLEDVRAGPSGRGVIPSPEAAFPVIVMDITGVAEDVLSLTLTSGNAGALPHWRPGAHIDLLLGNGLERQYSLCGDPDDHERWNVAVLRERDSRGGSRLIHQQLRPGDILMARAPRNHFALGEAKRYLFIAGGIGITPIVPMIGAVAARGLEWSLLYGGRRRSSMAFLDHLSGYGDRVEVSPEDEFGLLALAGYLGEPREDTLVYCCGPEPLLAATESACASWPRGALHVERFAPRPAEPGRQPGPGFELVLSRSALTLRVEPDQTIIEAIESRGITVPCSCLEGTCGTCETTVLAGRPDHRDSILTEEERQAGRTMMICVGRSLSPRLELDL